VPFHQRDTRWAAIVAHRRKGKTVAAVAELIIRAIYSTRQRPRYGYLAPFREQAKTIAWEYLKDLSKPFVQSQSDVRESDLSVRLFNNALIRLFGSDNPDALRGGYFDGIVLDEYGDCRPSLWGEVVLPTLADRKGWAVFIGTPKGKNHFYDVYRRSLTEPGWFSLTLKASESDSISQSELDEMRRQMTDSEYRQELECDFTAAVLGTYYAQTLSLIEEKGQVQPDAPQHDPSQPVHVAADLGRKDSTALWFWQHAPDGIAMIDYYEASGRNLEHYFDVLDARPYRYEKIWLPHDARAKTLATRRSTVEQFLEPPQVDDQLNPLTYKRSPYPVDIVPELRKQQGIDAARLILPHCYFNQSTCNHGIEALRAYRRKYDEVKKVYSNDSLHDWASDGADAFRYFALVTKERLPQQPRTETMQEGETLPGPEWRLDEMWDQTKSTRFQFERARI
jgi:hypothetical protein